MINIRRTKKSPNINKGRGSWKPDIIVCHISEGYYESGCDWLCNPAAEASTHFFVGKKGEVSQLVDIRDTAWGNGTTTGASDSRYYGHSAIQAVRDRKTTANNYTVSIEQEGFYKDNRGSLTEAQLQATVELIQHIISEVKKQFGIDIPIDRQHIVGHCDIAPKWKPNCPGQCFPFDEVIRRLKAVTPTPADYIIPEDVLKHMMDKGVIQSPDYWRDVRVQYLKELLINADKDGILDKRINNGVTDMDYVFDILIDSKVIGSPDYWKNLVRSGTVKYLDALLTNIANKCRIVLEKIVHAEAQGEGLEGQEFVTNVIMNRNKDRSFPNGIYNIVFQKTVKDGKTTYQFSPIGDGAYAKAVPSPSVKQAVDNVLNGKDNANGATFFCTITSASRPDNWHEKNLEFLFTHGEHRFYKYC